MFLLSNLFTVSKVAQNSPNHNYEELIELAEEIYNSQSISDAVMLAKMQAEIERILRKTSDYPGCDTESVLNHRVVKFIDKTIIMFIPIEEAIKKNIPIVGQGKKPDFTVSSMADWGVKVIDVINEIQDILNKNLKISDYSKKRIEHLLFTSIIYKDFESGVIRYEQKYYRKKRKNLFVDLRNPHYEAFCKADKKEALSIMAKKIFPGSEKFLKDEKDFNYPKFYSDIEKLFKDNNLI